MSRLALMLLLCGWVVCAQTKKIVVVSPDPAVVSELQRGSPPAARVVAVTPANLMQEIVDADAVIGEVKPEHVRAAKNLKWVQVMAAGVERVLHLSGGNELRDSKIVLTNNQIVQGPEIADHAMAMLLTL